MTKIINIFSFVFLLFFATGINAQDGVLGIKFGTSKSQAKELLEDRFGLVVEDGEKLKVYNGTFDGISFTALEFNFSWINNKSYFNSAYFWLSSPIEDFNYMKKLRDILFDDFKKKYEYYEICTNDQGITFYKFGTNPNDKSKVTGMIDLYKSKSVEKGYRYYLVVQYFPFIVYSNINDL